MRLFFIILSILLLSGCESTPELAAPPPPMPIHRVLVVPFDGAAPLTEKARTALLSRIQGDGLTVEGLPLEKTPFYTPTALDGGVQVANAGYDLVLFGRIVAGSEGLLSLEAYRPEKNEMLFSNVTSLFSAEETPRAVNTLWDGFRSRFPEKLTIILAGATIAAGEPPVASHTPVVSQDLPPPPAVAAKAALDAQAPPVPAVKEAPPPPVQAVDVAAKPPATVAAPTSAPMNKGYSVQAGAFLDRQRAEERLALLKSKGYGAFLVQVRDPVSGRMLHAVRFGHHADLAMAEAARKLFQDKEGVPAIISSLAAE